METEIVNGREKPTIAALKSLKKGQWIFTCSMKPLQFDSFGPEKSHEDYDRSAFTDAAWERFSKYDDFNTVEGSHHSVFHCGLRTISEGYAKWFIENKIDELFPDCKGEVYDAKSSWEEYVNKIKQRCQEAGIEFEGY